ncbi:MAG: acyl-CoA dehydrogenase family protein [Deinococcota bacterium]|nr:acyl-CoA dehydrogenase family protein [Deinococcota bacterium]
MSREIAELTQSLARQLSTRAPEADRKGALPPEDVRVLREAGYFSLSVPQERVPTALGKPIASLAKVQRQLGELEVAVDAAKTLLLAVAQDWSLAPREALFPRVVAAKHLATETAIEVTERALRIAGGASVTRSLPLERYFRDARAGLMHPPSGDAALEFVGRHVLGAAGKARRAEPGFRLLQSLGSPALG